MKKLIVVTVLATTATAASAFDYKFNLEGRADLVNANVKTTSTAGVTSTEKYNNFSNGLVRLNLMGAINENLSYRFRYRFLASAAAPSTAGTRENATTGLDYLYLDHKHSLFTTRLGKQNWGGAPYGREGIVSGTDVFLLSEAGSRYKSGFGSDYRYGVTAMMKFAETNSVDIGISNPNSTFTDNSGVEEKNTSLAYNIVYQGTFLNKMVQPVLSYAMASQDADADGVAGTRSKKGDNTMWNAGLRSEIAGLVIDADYKMFKKENRNTSITTTLVQEETKSIYANVAYAIGDFTPLATYINDKFDSETNTADFKRNSFAIGTYYRPMSDVNFRYHLMFTSAQTKAENSVTAVSKVDDKKFYLGFKADI